MDRDSHHVSTALRDYVYIAALATLVLGLFFVTACTSPSQEGVQGRLKASLPVDAVLNFE